MRTIMAKAHIEAGKITIETIAPTDLAEGDHDVIIQVAEQHPTQQLTLSKTWRWDNWPADSRFSREDIYGDDGR